MSRNLTILGALILTFPIAVDAPRDSAGARGHVTTLALAGGTGTYALIARDCEGNPLSRLPVDYRELGGQIDQEITGPLHVGIRGGAFHEEGQDSLAIVTTNSYANPYLAAEWRRVGLGVGAVWSKNPMRGRQDLETIPFSAHLRLGTRRMYVSGEIMEGMPLYSGGGYFAAGVGFRPAASLDSWIGVSNGPFDGGGVLARANWHMNPRWTLDVNARLGSSESEKENAISVGVTSRLGGK